MEKATLKLVGMSCASCAATIEKALKQEKGVKSAQVNFAAEKAYVQYNPKVIDRNRLVEVVRSTGYDVAQRDKAILKIGGMSCASCASTIEGALKKAPGVLYAAVNLATERASVEPEWSHQSQSHQGWRRQFSCPGNQARRRSSGYQGAHSGVRGQGYRYLRADRAGHSGFDTYCMVGLPGMVQGRPNCGKPTAAVG